MSLDDLRDAVSREKKNEIAIRESSRRRKLRELYSITTLINAGPGLHEFTIHSPPDADEQRFLDENDISKGRLFRDETLPFPVKDAISRLPKPRKAEVSIASSSRLGVPKSISDTTFKEVDRGGGQPRSSPQDTSKLVRDNAPKDNSDLVAHQATSEAHGEEIDGGHPESTQASTAEIVRTSERDRFEQPKGAQSPVKSEVNPSAVADASTFEPTRDQNAAFTAAMKTPNGLSQSLRVEVATGLKHATGLRHGGDQPNLGGPELRFDAPPSRRQNERELLHATPNFVGEITSSPSSTAGANSSNTPRPNVHSPDTSPDEEGYANGLPHPILDQAHKATKVQSINTGTDGPSQQLTDAALPSPETPDAQLRLEQEQASRSKLQPSSSREIELPAEGHRHAVGGQSTEPAAMPGASRDVSDDQHEKQNTRPDPVHRSVLEVEGMLDVGRQQKRLESVEHKEEIAQAVSNNKAPQITQSNGDRDVEMKDVSLGPTEKSLLAPPAEVRSATAGFPPLSPNSESGITAGAPIETKVDLEPKVGTSQTPRSPYEVAAQNRSELPTNTESQRMDQEISSTSPHLVATSESNHYHLNRKERKDRFKPSTVIFSKRDQRSQPDYLNLLGEDYASLKGASQDGKRDYLHGLFVWQAHQPPRSLPLLHLLSSANKTVTTSNQYASIREELDYRILKRVYQLQNANKWSFRQLERSQEPSQPVTYLDSLLSQMKWMRTDFREERKWRAAVAKNMAEWCAEWISADADGRAALQVKVKRTPDMGEQSAHMDSGHHDAHEPLAADQLAADQLDASQATPTSLQAGLNGSEHQLISSEHELQRLAKTPAPAALFSLGYSDVVFGLERTLASDNLLSELPSYEPVPSTPNLDVAKGSSSKADPPVVPVSKFVTGKLISKPTGPPKKRSRYDYEEEEETESRRHKRVDSSHSMHSMHSMSMLTGGRSNWYGLPPQQTDVALFNPENKHVRDRLHAGHAFRPPSEFGMPSVNFFESRASSQWLWDEDQKLRSLVREYSYNWSLISASLSLPSMLTSGAERRTPWECFERWVQLEGLPAEMSKTAYFKTYQSRLEAAQRTVSAQHQAAQQQLQQNQQHQAQTPGQQLSTPLRRRTTQPIRVERRKNNRYLGWIDCMRKLARRRETAQHKQQEAAKAAALRKAHEAVQPKSQVHTPQQFSQLKYERECKIEMHRQKLLAQQRNAALQRAQQPAQQQPAANAGAGVHRVDAHGSAQVPVQLGNIPSQPAQVQPAVNVQARSQSSHGGMPNNVMNGIPPGPQMALQGIPQAPMQINMQNQPRMPIQPTPENLRIAMQQRALQVSNQQYHLQQQQAQHLNQTATLQNNAMLTGIAGPTVNGTTNTPIGAVAAPVGSSASPRMAQPTIAQSGQPQPLSSGHIPTISHISHQIQAQNPHLSPDQLRQLANERLKGHLYQQTRQNALNAAAGASAAGASGANGFQQHGPIARQASPSQQYHQQMHQRVMQQRSQQPSSPALNGPRPPSRGTTPQAPQLQRPGP